MSIRQNFPTTPPSLVLDFANSKTLDPRITFSRTNPTATRMNELGLIESVGSDIARFDHRYDSSTGSIKCLGLLTERQKTNFIRHNEELDNTSVWGRSGVGISTNATISPTGELTAEKIIDAPGVAGNQHWLRIRATGLSTTGTYTASAYMKFDPENNLNGRGISLTITDAETGGSSYSAIRVLEGGDYAITSDDFTNTTGNVDTLPNGWYRAHLIFTNAGATTELSLRLQLTTSSGGAVYDSDGSSGVFAWGAQLEPESTLTSYIPNPTSSQITRTADSTSIEGSNMTDWYNPYEGTAIVDSLVEYDPKATRFVWSFNGGSSVHSLRQPHLTGLRFRAVIGGVFTPAPGTGGFAINGSTTKAAVAYDSTTGRLQVGTSSNEVTNIGIADATSFNLGTNNGRIKKFTYYPTRLSNDNLQTLTK